MTKKLLSAGERRVEKNIGNMLIMVEGWKWLDDVVGLGFRNWELGIGHGWLEGLFVV